MDSMPPIAQLLTEFTSIPCKTERPPVGGPANTSRKLIQNNSSQCFALLYSILLAGLPCGAPLPCRLFLSTLCPETTVRIKSDRHRSKRNPRPGAGSSHPSGSVTSPADSSSPRETPSSRRPCGLPRRAGFGAFCRRLRKPVAASPSSIGPAPACPPMSNGR